MELLWQTVHNPPPPVPRGQIVHVGVSVGAATVQLVALQLELEASGGSAQARVVGRRVLSRRGPAPTPYMKDGSLDVGALGFALLEAGANSPVLGDGIGGRVAVLSGYAAEEDNAYWMGRALADIDYSPYLCLRAGPNLGAVLAAYGGDAVALSGGEGGDPRTVLNVDLGASTVKLALCRGGDIVECAALALGTRSIAFDALGRIEELRPAAARAAEAGRIALASGAVLDPVDRQALTQRLVDCIFNVVERGPLEPLAQSLMLTAPLRYTGPLDILSFTGGGAEYVFNKEERDFGDLGPSMGRAVHERAQQLGVTLHEPEFPMRATLLGGAQYRLGSGNGKPTFAEPASFAAAREKDTSFLSVAGGARVPASSARGV